MSGSLPAFLDWAGSRFAGFGRWIGRGFDTRAKKKKSKSVIQKQRKAYQKALDEAYDGEDISAEQKRKMDDALYELLRDY